MAQFEMSLTQARALAGSEANFDAAVVAYIEALKVHQHSEGEPAPTPPHAWVELAVARVQEPGKPDTFVPNYKFIDDTPPPPTLDERKTALAHDLTVQAQRVVDGIMPPLKRRLWAIQSGKAYAVPEKDRGDGHKTTIATHEDRQDKVAEIELHLAQMHSDIHDLTDATFDAWKPAPFPG